MPPDRVPRSLRDATAADAPAIAALHVASWRATYRGSYSDAYLDGPIAAERDAFWRDRLAAPDAGLLTLLLESDEGRLAGFVCGIPDQDPRWGTLIDNLHVAGAYRGLGCGRRLMRSFAERLERDGAGGPVHLFVLASNHAARRFYARIRGETVERLVETLVDGAAHPIDRVAWPSASALREGSA